MAKGFGKPQAVPTSSATKFMRAFAKCYAKTKGDKEKINNFLKAHLSELDEALLEALPLVFNKLVAGGQFGERENVAASFVNFGKLLQEFSLGDRALNLEVSIVAYQVALKGFPREALPQDWAATQNNLGTAYSDRIRGDLAENLEKRSLPTNLPYRFAPARHFLNTGREQNTPCQRLS